MSAGHIHVDEADARSKLPEGYLGAGLAGYYS